MTDEKRCPDCGTPVGHLHRDGCDVARCKWSGRQYLSCDNDHAGRCELTAWTGSWPGEDFALAQGWLYGPGLPDLNRVYLEQSQGTVVWDPELEDFRLRVRTVD